MTSQGSKILGLEQAGASWLSSSNQRQRQGARQEGRAWSLEVGQEPGVEYGEVKSHAAMGASPLELIHNYGINMLPFSKLGPQQTLL